MTRPGSRWRAFTRDFLVVLAIGVGVSFLPGGKYAEALGSYDSDANWLFRYIAWALTVVLAVTIASRHLRNRKGPRA